MVTDRLPARGRLNLALHALRATVAAAGDDPAPVLAGASRVREVAALPDSGAADPRVAALLAQVEAVARPDPGAADFARLGPMSDAARAAAGNRLQWSVRTDDPAVVAYRAQVNATEDVTLVFRRVVPEGASASTARASYVLTTEISTGVFDDLLTAAGRWADVRTKRMLPAYDPTRGDPRPGPRTWEWPRYGRAPGITRSLVWLSGDFVPPGLDHYPESIGSEFNRSVIRDAAGERSESLNPTRRQPMQYVTPAAAQLAAGVVGCRLPTPAEWAAALKAAEPQAGANLRDRTWRLELDHLAKPQFNGRARPDAGGFVPVGEKPSDAVWQTAAGAEYDDGVLWFRETPASAPQTFVDLTGNVGELVADDAAAGKVYVIGSSSMSPPTRPADKAFALSKEQTEGAWSDVGFRLAFTEPAPTLDKLREAVAGGWYATAK